MSYHNIHLLGISCLPLFVNGFFFLYLDSDDEKFVQKRYNIPKNTKKPLYDCLKDIFLNYKSYGLRYYGKSQTERNVPAFKYQVL